MSEIGVKQSLIGQYLPRKKNIFLLYFANIIILHMLFFKVQNSQQNDQTKFETNDDLYLLQHQNVFDSFLNNQQLSESQLTQMEGIPTPQNLAYTHYAMLLSTQISIVSYYFPINIFLLFSFNNMAQPSAQFLEQFSSISCLSRPKFLFIVLQSIKVFSEIICWPTFPVK